MHRDSLFTVALAALTAAAPAPGQQLTAFRNVSVFDGENAIRNTDVLLDGGKVVSVGKLDEFPHGAKIVNGQGQWLLPGLIDAHTHTWDRTQLQAAAAVGVTTQLDMFTAAPFFAAEKSIRENLGEPGFADLYSCGTLVTAPGGHGTQYGMPIDTLSSPEGAEAFIRGRIAEGADYIKLVYDDGEELGFDMPTLSPETLRAAIAAAHRHDLLAVVHVHALSKAKDAERAGADGLVHMFFDEPIDDEFVALIKESGAFVVPTLTVIESVTGAPSGAAMAGDPRLAPVITPAMAENLKAAFPANAKTARALEIAAAGVRRLHAEGVTILAGSDAPNPGTAHGLSLHREMELLVEKGGMTPLEALRAATQAPAEAFGLPVGRIEPGARADLVLVFGDPTKDISHTRNVNDVWQRGVEVDREDYIALVQDEHTKARRQKQAMAMGDGLISDFETGEPDSAFGAGWATSTDAMMGGKSTAQMRIVEGGAGRSKHALETTGTLATQPPAWWAGVMFFPGRPAFTAVNASSRSKISFMARGDGRDYAVMMFSGPRGATPPQQGFTAGDEWERVEMAFDAFRGFDPEDLQGVLFTATGDAGEFRLQIDDVRFE